MAQNDRQDFPGVDHTAIVVRDSDASLRFYRDILRMRVTGESENYGAAQERLNNVFGAPLHITTLRPDSGPGVELLQYLVPGNGRSYPAGEMANDLMHWQTRFSGVSVDSAAGELRRQHYALISSGVVNLPASETGFRKSVIVRDPDGHAVEIVDAKAASR